MCRHRFPREPASNLVGQIEVKRKPDFLLILMAVFGMGVLVTLLLPMANDTVAAPASELQAGIIIRE